MALEDVVRAAHRPLTITTARRGVYAARPVSAHRCLQFLDAWEAAPTYAAREAALRALLREAFPWRLSYRWRGDPVDAVLALPLPDRQAWCDAFFAHLGLARPVTLPA